MQKYKKLYGKIEKLKDFYDKLLSEVKNMPDRDDKRDAVLSLIRIAMVCNPGYWTCSYIEKYLADYAKTIKLEDYSKEYIPNSFLHVMTTGYSSGGHTRVVERCIENAPQTQSHSVVILNNSGFDTLVLENNIKEKNGQLIIFNGEDSINKKALDLRKLALNYEYIVLHTHMHDIIPTLAFGVEEFKRPVILYNHATHLFWIGKSIADVVIDIINGDNVTKIRRNIPDSYFMGIPSKEIVFKNKDKVAARIKLGIPLDKKIIVTSGKSIKFSILDDEDNYARVIEKIINKNTYCYMIGLDKNDKKWSKYIRKSKGHIIQKDSVGFYEGYLDYLAAADLYIDSYPIAGGTAMMDAISQNTPSISLKSTFSQLNYLTETRAYLDTPEEFIKTAKKILNDESFGAEITAELQNSLVKYQSKQAWNQRMDNLLKIVPKEHIVKDLSNEEDNNIIDDYTVLVNVSLDKNFFGKNSKINTLLSQSPKATIKNGILYRKFGIPYILEIKKYTKGCFKIININLFNIKIYEKKKRFNI